MRTNIETTMHLQYGDPAYLRAHSWAGAQKSMPVILSIGAVVQV